RARNDGGLAARQDRAAGAIADFDRTLAGGQRDGVRIDIGKRVFGAANADGRDRSRDLVVITIGLAEQPGDGAQAAAEQSEQALLLAVLLAGETVVVEPEVGLRLQGNPRAIIEAQLRPAIGSGLDGLTREHLAP